MYRPVQPMRHINLHVRRVGSVNGRHPLLFRDYLRAHPLTASDYGQTKVALG